MVCFAEPLEVDHFPCSEELDGIPYIGVVGETQDVVIGHASFLLSTQVFVQVRDGVACNRKRRRVKGHTGSRCGIHRSSVIHKVILEPSRFDLFRRHVPGKLVHNGAHHFQVSQFFCTQ